MINHEVDAKATAPDDNHGLSSHPQPPKNRPTIANARITGEKSKAIPTTAPIPALRL
jgi:hypothetical protein